MADDQQGLEIMSALAALAERVTQGGAITEADARVVLASRDLITIGVMGDDVRRRMHGARTTFVRVFEIHVDAPPAGRPPHVSAGEFRIIGRPASLEAAVKAVRAASAISGGVAVTGFSLVDLQALASQSATPVDEVCATLRSAGLEAIAEVPVDLAGGSVGEAVKAARAAGLLVARLTVHALADARALDPAVRARDLQAALGGFRAFAPLPRTMSVTEPSTGYDDVKQVTIARLLAANIESIQVDWALYGPKLAQIALTTGADDIDSVAAQESGALGTRRSSIEELRGNVRAAGLEPIERNGTGGEAPAEWRPPVGVQGAPTIQKRCRAHEGGPSWRGRVPERPAARLRPGDAHRSLLAALRRAVEVRGAAP
jgi:aminodeoxyfutalosine synthase